MGQTDNSVGWCGDIWDRLITVWGGVAIYGTD